MANTYTQLYIQIVFSTRNRRPVIHEKIRNDVQKYITGIIQKEGSKVMAIYANPDHLHILIGLNPSTSLSSLVQKIKANSSRWLKQKGFVSQNFEWQKGYGAFSYSRSELNRVIDYILKQPEHHKKLNYKEEYLNLLKEFDVQYDPKYVF